MELEELITKSNISKLRICLGKEDEFNKGIEEAKQTVDKAIEEGYLPKDGLCPLLYYTRRFEIFKYIAEKLPDNVYRSDDINILIHYISKYYQQETKEDKELYLLFIILVVKSVYGKKLCNWVHQETLLTPIHVCKTPELFILIYKELDDETKELISISDFDTENMDPNVLEFLKSNYTD